MQTPIIAKGTELTVGTVTAIKNDHVVVVNALNVTTKLTLKEAENAVRSV